MQVKKYGLKAINDEAETCSICGKVHLKRVMWIVELDQDGNPMGDVFNCGTTCGAKLLGLSVSQMNTRIKHIDFSLACQRKQLQESHPAQVEAWQIVEVWNKQGLTYAQRKQTPEYAHRAALVAQAQEWANAQEIIVEL